MLATETAGREDENHAWNAIGVVGADNSWVHSVNTRSFGSVEIKSGSLAPQSLYEAQVVDRLR